MFWKKEKEFKFIATFELGRLGRWLRLLGYDCDYFKEGRKGELVIRSLREERVILTRETGMSRFSGTRMIRIKNDFVEDQLKQVLKTLRLKVNPEKLFTKCTLCNSSIKGIEKDKIKDRVPPYVYKTQNDFKICAKCRKIYWKGTHWKLAADFLKTRSRI